MIASQRSWLDRETERRRVDHNIKEAEARGLAATLTLNQWLRAVEYFGGLCAYCLYCRHQVMDHWIPLVAKGGTTADNCIPACRGCNEAKSALNPKIDDIAGVLSRGALFRALAYTKWVRATSDDSPVFKYIPGALADRRTHRSAPVEEKARAVWSPGMSVGELERKAGIARSVAGKYRRLFMAEDTRLEQVAR